MDAKLQLDPSHTNELVVGGAELVSDIPRP